MDETSRPQTPGKIQFPAARWWMLAIRLADLTREGEGRGRFSFSRRKGVERGWLQRGFLPPPLRRRH